jgi:hypothetical protein
LWTRDEYDNAVENLEDQGPGDFGIRGACVLNCLKSFHAIGQFPLDGLHDILEKLVPYDGASILFGLIGQGLFTLQDYNRQLSDVRLQGYERSDRPLPLKARSEKLPGKALAVGQHMRLMPYVIWRMTGDLELDDNIFLELLILLHRINEFVQADSVSLADLQNFEDLLVDYFEKRKLCSNAHSFVQISPRMHFVTHYPSEVQKFGPLNGYWTARPEGKHRQFVNFAESAKNFINLPKTLAEKHQKLLASK